MPYINIQITREGASREQKAQLIRGATDLVVQVLGKNPATTFVVIEEVDTDHWGIAGRGEYLRDPKGFLTGYDNEEISLVSGTLTIEALPADFLTIKLDGRIDWSNKEIFQQDIRDLTGKQFTTTLGVVAHTD